MRRDVPDLSAPLAPLTYAGQVAAALAEAEAITAAHAQLDDEMERRDRRRLERETAADRRWRPQFRCDSCHSYVTSAVADCPQCGHRGATADEGQRTSYKRAHARRGARKGLRR